jgi:hypothetical protein
VSQSIMGTLDYAARIELDTAAQSNGLALMVADLILQNLKEHPSKREDFARLRGRVAIVAEDADVAMTLHFEGNMLTVYDGIEGIPDVTVRACGEDIVQLSLLPLTRLGLPDLRGEAGRALMQKTQSGQVRVYGALLHIPLVLRFTRLLSVN